MILVKHYSELYTMIRCDMTDEKPCARSDYFALDVVMKCHIAFLEQWQHLPSAQKDGNKPLPPLEY